MEINWRESFQLKFYSRFEVGDGSSIHLGKTNMEGKRLFVKLFLFFIQWLTPRGSRWHMFGKL